MPHHVFRWLTVGNQLATDHVFDPSILVLYFELNSAPSRTVRATNIRATGATLAARTNYRFYFLDTGYALYCHTVHTVRGFTVVRSVVPE